MKKYTTTEKNEMKQEIKGCLINGNYQHQFVLLTDNSINSLKFNVLICVYVRIVEKIMNTPSKREKSRTILRPACPISSPENLIKQK